MIMAGAGRGPARAGFGAAGARGPGLPGRPWAGPRCGAARCGLGGRYGWAGSLGGAGRCG